MKEHYHLTIEHIVVYGISALIFFQVMRIVGVQLGKQEGPVGTVGRALGGVVYFGQ